MKPIRYMRRPEVLRQTGISNSTLHTQIIRGLFAPPISLGARSVGWIEHEVQEILSARAEGSTELEIKKLVKALVDSRRSKVSRRIEQ